MSLLGPESRFSLQQMEHTALLRQKTRRPQRSELTRLRLSFSFPASAAVAPAPTLACGTC